MPGIIISELATNIVDKLSSSAMTELGAIFGVKDDLAKLQRTFSAIQAVLLDAEQKQDHDHAVKHWLGNLEDTAYDVDDLLDKFAYEYIRRGVITEGMMGKQVRLFFSKHNQLAFRFKIANEIRILREKLDYIADDRTKYHFQRAVDDWSKIGQTRDTHSFVPEEEVIGRDEEKEAVVKRLLEINGKENISVDAIVGIGGIGKTMLAQSVFQHEKVKQGFDLRMWVCISPTFDLKQILEKIIASATNQRLSGLGMDILQHEIRDQIDGKKYLLVMDDVWNEKKEKWLDLTWLLTCGAKGSKILITTRSHKVAKISQAPNPYVLKGLSESDSWILLKKWLFVKVKNQRVQT